jgi:hypothetical protein
MEELEKVPKELKGYRVSSRTSRATQRNPVSSRKTKKKKKKVYSFALG